MKQYTAQKKTVAKKNLNEKICGVIVCKYAQTTQAINKHMLIRELRENFADGNAVTPMLYHATYRPFLDSIMKNGLGGKGAQTQWEDSKPGYVYLAKDPEVAVSHAEANELVPDEYIDDIVVLSIDASQLDYAKLEDDPNVMDDDSTLAYNGIIPSTAFKKKK